MALSGMLRRVSGRAAILRPGPGPGRVQRCSAGPGMDLPQASGCPPDILAGFARRPGPGGTRDRIRSCGPEVTVVTCGDQLPSARGRLFGILPADYALPSLAPVDSEVAPISPCLCVLGGVPCAAALLITIA